jgi:hypothetical protein
MEDELDDHLFELPMAIYHILRKMNDQDTMKRFNREAKHTVKEQLANNLHQQSENQKPN